MSTITTGLPIHLINDDGDIGQDTQAAIQLRAIVLKVEEDVKVYIQGDTLFSMGGTALDIDIDSAGLATIMKNSLTAVSLVDPSDEESDLYGPDVFKNNEVYAVLSFNAGGLS